MSKDVIVKTLIVAQPHVLHSYRMCRPSAPVGSDSVCFEVLGFDVLLDRKMRPWLLEVISFSLILLLLKPFVRLRHNVICGACCAMCHVLYSYRKLHRAAYWTIPFNPFQHKIFYTSELQYSTSLYTTTLHYPAFHSITCNTTHCYTTYAIPNQATLQYTTTL